MPTHPALLRHGDSGLGFRHRIHGRADERDIEGDPFRDGVETLVSLGSMAYLWWNQQHIIKS